MNYFAKHLSVLIAVLALFAASQTQAQSVDTENYGLQVVPAPGKVEVDGLVDDWDLSGGVFTTSDIETQRDQYAVWTHAMYDKDYLYILARWNDQTPMNNPNQTIAGSGFQGDSLQFRIITRFKESDERPSHWTAWKGSDGEDIINVDYRYFGKAGKDKPKSSIPNAKEKGALQAFAVNEDGQGYVQEIAIPWSLLVAEGVQMKPGDQFIMTIEPNMTTGKAGRLTMKDVFKEGVAVDRVFTFQSPDSWGTATLVDSGKLSPRPVRLSDGRTFPVTMVEGKPSIDISKLFERPPVPGVVPIKFEVPEDGYVSLLIRDREGRVVRNLLGGEFFTKGQHEVMWDGLGQQHWSLRGSPVAVGEYTWEALHHPGLKLRLRGWANNAGIAPWDNGRDTNWGGDHGFPSSVVVGKKQVYLGWTGAESGSALVACNMDAKKQWGNTRGGIGGAVHMGIDDSIIFVLKDGPAKPTNTLYKINDKGAYVNWEGISSPDLPIKNPAGVAAHNGEVFLSYFADNVISVLDAKTGEEKREIDVAGPGALHVGDDGGIYIVSTGKPGTAEEIKDGRVIGRQIMRLDPAKGDELRTVVSGLDSVVAATAAGGEIYAGLEAPANQVHVFDAAGKKLREIGVAGGRPKTGPWVAGGLRSIRALAVDGQGRLWVAEGSKTPQRFSLWDANKGTLLQELFGPTHYGASGGTIFPKDPNIMISEGAEWKMDPETGRAVCLGVFDNAIAGAARFFFPSNGKVYLVTNDDRGKKTSIFERLGEGNYALRTVIDDASLWTDVNGDGEQQPDEMLNMGGSFNASGYLGWSLGVDDELGLYGKLDKESRHFPVVRFAPSGAPVYDPQQSRLIPATGIPTADGRYLLARTTPEKGVDFYTAYDLQNNNHELWSYPNAFHGVHGSHRAAQSRPGMLRGAFDPVGTARLSSLGGDVWVWAINSNLGEWHLLASNGQYIGRLFEGDAMRFQWPAEALPGAVLDRVPPGMGMEDFGGSFVQSTDGSYFVQAGKTATWNVSLTGLEKLQAMGSGKIQISEQEVSRAVTLREELEAGVAQGKSMVVKQHTPNFTGDPEKDFGSAALVEYKRGDARVETRVAWDDKNLYVSWNVEDRTPWVNGAPDPTYLYIGGDTVDLQISTDPNADKNRDEAVQGDTRISIGNFKGNPTAVLYRQISTKKAPATFSSGVVAAYTMEEVRVVDIPGIKVQKPRPDGRGYIVEAAIPWEVIGAKPEAGSIWSADFGATFGDPAGARTRLRNYWSNQDVGLVDDAVYELKMVPRNWGEIRFE
jgi:hypothetical protein